jgi:hypothetical protein
LLTAKGFKNYIYFERWRSWTLIRNTWKIWQCGAGEGWRQQVGYTVWEIKKYYIELRRTGHSLGRNCFQITLVRERYRKGCDGRARNKA